METLKAFVAGFISTLIFHQGMLAFLHAVGFGAPVPYSFAATAPFYVPQVISLAFWGGVWGVLLWTAIRPVLYSGWYWLLAIVLGAIAPTLVAWYVVLPLKGLPTPNGLHAAELAAMINGAWGFGVALLMRATQRRRDFVRA